MIWKTEFTVPPDDKDGVCGIKVEDGGQAMVMYNPMEDEPKEEGGDGCFYVRFNSWDESDVPKHELFKSLMGKKVRVTVEVIE